ncbi:MAG: Gfo/Idh/MocA family protein [Armatimonadota bacterium]
MKVGLVGAGAVARAHLTAYIRHPSVEAVIAADKKKQAREALASQYGIIKGTARHYEELLADDDIALVDVCTPHDTHHPIAMAALSAGKDVICEKPLALTLEQADEMIAAAEEHSRRLFCALNQRMFPAHLRAKEIIDEGDLGEPFFGVVVVVGDEFARMNDPESWKGEWKQAGGGALFDTGYHAIYMLQHFLGEATAVTASTRRCIVEPENKADDCAVASLEMGPKRQGSISITYSATGTPWAETRLLVGTKGSLQIVDADEEVGPLSGFYEKEFIPLPVHNPPDLHSYSIRQTICHFLDCVHSGEEPDITLDEARSALATAIACYESARRGRRVEVAG